jgi:hypothetical protein
LKIWRLYSKIDIHSSVWWDIPVFYHRVYFSPKWHDTLLYTVQGFLELREMTDLSNMYPLCSRAKIRIQDCLASKFFSMLLNVTFTMGNRSEFSCTISTDIFMETLILGFLHWGQPEYFLMHLAPELQWPILEDYHHH